MAYKKAKLYEIRDQGGYIGTVYAMTPQAAINKALENLNAGASTFRRSWTRITFKAPTAVEIQPNEKD